METKYTAKGNDRATDAQPGKQADQDAPFVALAKKASQLPFPSNNRKQFESLSLGNYCKQFCEFVDGIPYIYDGGYRQLSEVLKESDQEIRRYICHVLTIQAKASSREAAIHLRQTIQEVANYTV